jgi:preprotein translocase subunit SecD
MKLSGLTDQDQAQRLAASLNLAALPVKLETSQVTVVNGTG